MKAKDLENALTHINPDAEVYIVDEDQAHHDITAIWEAHMSDDGFVCAIHIKPV